MRITNPARSKQSRSHDSLVLALVCTAQFMVVLDISIVNVALPHIKDELDFGGSSLQWVLNAYTLTFAGFLLLGGRAADIVGHRVAFLAGLTLFGVASLACGSAPSPGALIAARAAQGLGGAVLAPVTLTVLTTTFTDGPARSRAMGAWTAVAGAGGAAGSVLGGLLTDLTSWRWIFFLNVPIAVVALAAVRVLLPAGRPERGGPLDVPGAFLVTGGLVALVYGIVSTEGHSWSSAHTVIPLVLSVLLLTSFFVHEGRFATAPLLPLRLLRVRTLAVANTVMLLVATGMFAMWFLLSLYMQKVLHYSPLSAGLAFVPQTLGIITGAQISSRLTPRTGVRPVAAGAIIAAAGGLLWLSRISADGSYLADLLVPGVLVTFAMGLAMTPIMFSAMSGSRPEEAGLSSGIINTTRQVGASIGLAGLATLAASRTHALTGKVPEAQALTSGYSRAFVVASIVVAVGAVAALALPGRTSRPATTAAPAEPAGPSAAGSGSVGDDENGAERLDDHPVRERAQQ